MPNAAQILYCDCAYAQIIPRAVKDEVLAGLRSAGVEFHHVDDLCSLSAQRDPLLLQLAESSELRIAACYPRAVKWLFAAAGAELSPTARIVNMRDRSSAAIQGELLPDAQLRADSQSAIRNPQSAVPRWFPVIDFDRCTHCMQCLNFCLFDVFGVVEKRIAVKHHGNCKADCPACSRVCPETAIIFPKYASAPINGDEVRPETTREPVKVDVSALLGGDVYAALRQRSSRQRFSKERDEQLALTERRAALAKLQKELDVPDELMESLSSLDQMRAKAMGLTNNRAVNNGSKEE